MKKLVVGGVPEHFNFPFTRPEQKTKFQSKNIDFTWIDYPKGTGDLSRALREKELDIAIILTEGIVRDIIKGNPSKIVQTYVKSPLIWGVHVANESDFEHISDLKGSRAAISRYGSGSHLMAYVNAQNENWDLENDLKFEVVNDLDGALQSLPNGESDYFMWEKFMTKPYVDQGVFRLIHHTPTPWPSFVIAVREDLLVSEPDTISTFLEVINETTRNFKEIANIDHLISDRFDLKIEDVRQWLELTAWSQNQLTINELDNVQGKLMQLNLISDTLASEEILHYF